MQKLPPNKQKDQKSFRAVLFSSYKETSRCFIPCFSNVQSTSLILHSICTFFDIVFQSPKELSQIVNSFCSARATTPTEFPIRRPRVQFSIMSLLLAVSSRPTDPYFTGSSLVRETFWPSIPGIKYAKPETHMIRGQDPFTPSIYSTNPLNKIHYQ